MKYQDWMVHQYSRRSGAAFLMTVVRNGAWPGWRRYVTG